MTLLRSALAVLLATASATLAAASSDPVNELRKLLRSETNPARPEQLKQRLRHLDAQAASIHSTADLIRAAHLVEWGEGQRETDRNRGGLDPLSDAKHATQAKLMEALAKSLRRELSASGGETRQLALLSLLRMAVEGQRSSFRVQRLPTELAEGTLPRPVAEAAAKAERLAVRVAALRTLASMTYPGEKMAVILRRALTSKQALERREAAAVLGRLVGDRLDYRNEWSLLLPLAAAGARDDDAMVRTACLTAIASGARRLAEETIRPSQGPEDGEANKPQDAGLGELGRALPAAVAAMADKDEKVCVAAHLAVEKAASLCYALASHRPTATRSQEKGPVKKVTSPDASDLVSATVKAIPALTKSLSRKEVRVRLAAIYVLETLGAGAAPAAEALSKRLKDDSRYVRWGAAGPAQHGAGRSREVSRPPGRGAYR